MTQRSPGPRLPRRRAGGRHRHRPDQRTADVPRQTAAENASCSPGWTRGTGRSTCQHTGPSGRAGDKRAGTAYPVVLIASLVGGAVAVVLAVVVALFTFHGEFAYGRSREGACAAAAAEATNPTDTAGRAAGA